VKKSKKPRKTRRKSANRGKTRRKCAKTRFRDLPTREKCV